MTTAEDYHYSAFRHQLEFHYQEAIKDYSKAIELEPDYYLRYSFRADCYKELKQYDLAIKDYSKAIELDPEDYWNYVHRADYYKELKQYELAIKDNEKALELVLDDGMKLFKDGDFGKAIKYLKVAAELAPDDKEIARTLELAQKGKIDIMTCTKKGLLSLDFIDNEKADQIIEARNEGKIWFGYQEFAQVFNFQPHEQLDIEAKIAFPLKQGAKLGRKIDF